MTMLFAARTFTDLLEDERRRVTEKWSDAARAASIAARQGRAKYTKDLDRVSREKRQQKATAKRASAKGAKDAEAAAKKAESETRKQVAASYDAKIKTAAAELRAMADRGDRASAAYRQKYAAYRALQDEKRTALGGAARVDAPEKEKKAKAEQAAKKAVTRKVVTRTERIPKTRNRFRQQGVYRRA